MNLEQRMKRVHDYKIKTNKIWEEKYKKLNRYFWIIWIMSIFFILTFGFIIIEESQKNQARTELLVFAVEEIDYCANRMNISLNDLQNDFIRYKTEQLLNKTKGDER